MLGRYFFLSFFLFCLTRQPSLLLYMKTLVPRYIYICDKLSLLFLSECQVRGNVNELRQHPPCTPRLQIPQILSFQKPRMSGHIPPYEQVANENNVVWIYNLAKCCREQYLTLLFFDHSETRCNWTQNAQTTAAQRCETGARKYLAIKQ